MRVKTLNFVEAMQVAEIIMSKPLPDNFDMVDIMDSLTIYEVIKIGEYINILPKRNQGVEYINKVKKELIQQHILELCKSYSHLIGGNSNVSKR